MRARALITAISTDQDNVQMPCPPDRCLTELGFAVAFGILLDTIVVRLLLVTALNLDLGRWMWLAQHAGPQARPGLRRTRPRARRCPDDGLTRRAAARRSPGRPRRG
jgi:MMPL family